MATHGTVSAGSHLLWLHKWGITSVSPQLGTVLSNKFGFTLSFTAGTMAGQSLWMSWKGCARSEPCRPTSSTPRSGESMFSPTQVLGCSGEPGQLPRPLCAPAFITSPVCSLCRVTRKLCGVHGPGGTPWQDHGAGPARWWPPHPWVHDGQEENFCHLCLLRVHALQGTESYSSQSQDIVIISVGAS